MEINKNQQIMTCLSESIKANPLKQPNEHLKISIFQADKPKQQQQQQPE